LGWDFVKIWWVPAQTMPEMPLTVVLSFVFAAAEMVV
jgi:hypothetical protein